MTTISYRLPSFVFWLANGFSSSQYSSASSRPLICSIHVVEWRMENASNGNQPYSYMHPLYVRRHMKWHMRLLVSDTNCLLPPSISFPRSRVSSPS